MDLGRSDYSPEEVEKLLTGEVTLRELGEVSNAKLLEIAEMGYSMLSSGKSKEAKTLFTGLIAVEPREPYFRTMLGCVFMVEENWARADELFCEALRLDPGDSNALVNRGEVRLRLGRLDEAQVDLATVVDMDPEGKEKSTHRARAIVAFVLSSLEAAQEAEPSKSSGGPQKK